MTMGNDYGSKKAKGKEMAMEARKAIKEKKKKKEMTVRNEGMMGRSKMVETARNTETIN